MKKPNTFSLKTQLPLLTLLIILFGFWWTTKNIPFWWDSAGYVVEGAHYIFEQNFSTLTIGPAGRTIAHPPLLMFLLALSWKIFGQTVLVAHILNLIFASILIIFTYKLAEFLGKDKFRVSLIGFGSSLILIFTPLFYAQLGIFYFDLTTASMAIPAIYFFFKGRFKIYFVFASLMLLFKETSVSVLIGLTLANLIYKAGGIKNILNLPKGQIFKESFAICSPFIVVITWLLYHQIETGWLFATNRRGVPLNLIPTQLLNIFEFTFFSQFRFLITIPLIIIIFAKRQTFFAKETIAFLTIILSVVLFFGLSEFLTRYILLTLPLLYLLFFYSLTQILVTPKKTNILIVFTIITLVFCGLFMKSWNDHKLVNNWYFPPLEDNLEYLDVISVSNQINNYLTKEHPKDTIVATFPNTYMLEDPYQGYVKKPLKVINCMDYQPGDQVDFLIFHFFSPEQVKCLPIIQEKDFQKALRFEKNGKFMILYYAPKK